MRRAGVGLVMLSLVGACGSSGGRSSEDSDAGASIDPDGGASLVVRPPPALSVHDDSLIHQAELTMSADDWQSIIDDSQGDTLRHASLTYDGVVVDDVGVHPSGESSRIPGNQKQSFRVKFDAFGHGKFAGIKEINIKGEYDDHSMMRERLAYFVFRQMLPTPQAAHVRLVVNGQLRGLYTIREVWDADSIGPHFTQPLGPLYRVRGAIDTDPYAYLGTATTAYVPLPWEPHIDKPARSDDVVPALLDVVNNNPTMLDSVVDVEDLLDFLAAFALVMDTDGFVGDHGVSDHFQYFDPQSGRFFILPWDPDNTFSSQNEAPDRSITKSFDRNGLSRLIADDSALRARYVAKIGTVMSTVSLAALQGEADAIYQQIQQAAYEDPFKSFSNSDFDWSEGYIKDFAAQRYASLQAQTGSN
jgi:spore coat protein CotH